MAVPARPRSLLKRALRKTGSLLLAVVVVGSVAMLLLAVFGVARFVPVLSDSMAPGMPKGSLAMTTPTARDAIAVGDVIVFTAPDGSARRIIHRVQHVYGPGEADSFEDWSTQRLFVQTGGDANPALDPWVVSIGDPVIWRRSDVVPLGGWIVIWAADPRIRTVAFVVVGFFAAAALLRVIWRRPAPALPIHPGESHSSLTDEEGDAFSAAETDPLFATSLLPRPLEGSVQSREPEPRLSGRL